ncbi:helix-turn-helix domain-containing protein [Tamlana flava]|uniref:helix-turn-helix domain-containing protein n=1 Tax=Tamlana flava TaxID=3158572 RepID=UPI00351ABDE3
MSDITQLHSITPEQLTERIFKGLDERLNILKQNFEPKEPDELLTAKELENELKISPTTRCVWQKKGILKPKKIGNRTYYLRSEIKELLNNS